MQQKLSKVFELNNGNKIPLIGYGTYPLQGEDCKECVKLALDIGYRHIDSASFYKNSTDIRDALAEVNLPREDIFITSKIYTTEQGYENTIQTCHRLLQEFNLAYLDLLLIHWPGVRGIENDDPQNQVIRLETYRALEELQAKGLVKNIGVSNFLKRHLEHLLKNVKVVPAVNQIEAHPLGWDVPTVEFCNQNKILIQAYCPLARQNPALMGNPCLLELTKKYQRSLSQISLRWAYQKGFSVIPKSKSEAYIRENFQIEDFEFSQEEMGEIDKLNIGLHVCWDPETIKY